jgi:DNA adenine methylase
MASEKRWRFCREITVDDGKDTTAEPANIRPFLRWAGSKRRLLQFLTPYMPKSIGKYYEPFLGGGAMFFYLGPKRAEISDVSTALIETYRAVRVSPSEVLKFLRPLTPSKKNYKQLKNYTPRSIVGRAGRFIFLNKACWNGLYRVNSDGIFNVPYGWPRTDFIIDEANLLRCAKQLRRREVSIKQQDFEEIERRVDDGDFVFLDPPYVTSHNMNGFVDWNECLFSWSDQVRLASMARKLVKKGANVLITNANHADVHSLYIGFGTATYSRWSNLASNTSRRGTTSEAIFFGGPAYARSTAPQRRWNRGAEDGSYSRFD